MRVTPVAAPPRTVTARMAVPHRMVTPRSSRRARKAFRMRTKRSVPRWGAPDTRTDFGAPKSVNKCRTCEARPHPAPPLTT